MGVRASFASDFDQLLRPQVRLLRRAIPAFQLCGYAGLAVAIALTQGLVLATGLTTWVMAVLSLAAMGVFLALAMLTKIIFGEEVLVYYHHEIAVLLATTAVLWALGQPVLRYLDLVMLGVGAFLVCGRLGCLMAGCCHGRPHRWGVCYGPEHVAFGFDPHLAGVRLLPTQLFEAGWVACIVAVGVTMVLAAQPAGSALAWYIVAYDLERFGLEFLRGDGRPYLLGFSEAQWISLGLLLAVVAAEGLGLLPWHWWHAGAALGMVGAMLLVLWRRRGSQRHRLLAPKHIAELAAALHQAAPQVHNPIAVATTSQGFQISASQLSSEHGQRQHYALSQPGVGLADGDARAVAELIMRLRHPHDQHKLLKGNHGVFHLLVQSRQGETGKRP